MYMYYDPLAQSVEHKTENLGVVGSIPTEATIFKSQPELNIYFGQAVLIAQLDRAFDYGSKG